MTQVLYVQASPRGSRSKSIAAADAFCKALRDQAPPVQIRSVNVFDLDLPAMDAGALDAKYEILHGAEPSGSNRREWSRIERVISQFTQADGYVLAVPMWNFGIPYRLKQYFDVIVQPGYTFSYDPAGGYQGLVKGKWAVASFARGGQYGPDASVDHQKSYLELILGFMGITEVHSLLVEPTLMAGPEQVDQRLDEARRSAGRLAEKLAATL
jgi:FMN-dependent NADH-azoreductase